MGKRSSRSRRVRRQECVGALVTEDNCGGRDTTRGNRHRRARVVLFGDVFLDVADASHAVHPVLLESILGVPTESDIGDDDWLEVGRLLSVLRGCGTDLLDVLRCGDNGLFLLAKGRGGLQETGCSAAWHVAGATGHERGFELFVVWVVAAEERKFADIKFRDRGSIVAIIRVAAGESPGVLPGGRAARERAGDAGGTAGGRLVGLDRCRLGDLSWDLLDSKG